MCTLVKPELHLSYMETYELHMSAISASSYKNTRFSGVAIFYINQAKSLVEEVSFSEQ